MTAINTPAGGGAKIVARPGIGRSCGSAARQGIGRPTAPFFTTVKAERPRGGRTWHR